MFDGDGKPDILLGRQKPEIAWYHNPRMDALRYCARNVSKLDNVCNRGGADIDGDGKVRSRHRREPGIPAIRLNSGRRSFSGPALKIWTTNGGVVTLEHETGRPSHALGPAAATGKIPAARPGRCNGRANKGGEGGGRENCSLTNRRRSP